MRFVTPIKAFLLISLINFLSLGYAIYAQLVLDVIPCPLCITQRIIIFALGICSLLFAFLARFSRGLVIKLYAFITGIIAIIGILVARDHNHLISLPPDQRPLSCGMPINVMFQQLSLPNFLTKILNGSAECAQVTWKVLGMNPPTAVIILCSISLVICLIVIIKRT